MQIADNLSRSYLQNTGNSMVSYQIIYSFAQVLMTEKRKQEFKEETERNEVLNKVKTKFLPLNLRNIGK